MSELARIIEALLFLSAEPVERARARAGHRRRRRGGRGRARRARASAYAPGERGLLLREVAGG